MTKMGKKEIRAEVKKRRAEAELGTLHENSKKIVETFVNLPQYQNTDLLLAYVDAKREVETLSLIHISAKSSMVFITGPLVSSCSIIIILLLSKRNI